jgi:hypothetical protein
VSGAVEMHGIGDAEDCAEENQSTAEQEESGRQKGKSRGVLEPGYFDEREHGQVYPVTARALMSGNSQARDVPAGGATVTTVCPRASAARRAMASGTSSKACTLLTGGSI